MIIGALKENKKDENRVALTPESAQLLAKLGHKCLIEKGAGASAGFAAAARSFVLAAVFCAGHARVA